MTVSTKIVQREVPAVPFKRVEVEQEYKVVVRVQEYQREAVQRIYREAVNGN